VSSETREKLEGFIFGYRSTAAVGVSLDLGLLDAVSRGQASSSSLAADLGLDQEWIDQLLRALQQLSIVEGSPDHVDLSSLGSYFVKNESIRAAMTYAWRVSYPNYLNLMALFSTDISNEARHPSASLFYDTLMMDGKSRDVYSQMLRIDTLGQRMGALLQGELKGYIYDIGGGDGTMLSYLLQSNPEAEGFILERPDVADYVRATKVDSINSITGRLHILDGDFRVSVPSNGQYYIYCRVFANWCDKEVSNLMAVLRKAIPMSSKFLIVEQLLPEDWQKQGFAGVANLDLVANFGGHLRSVDSFKNILSNTGFSLNGVIPLTESDESNWCLLIAAPR